MKNVLLDIPNDTIISGSHTGLEAPTALPEALATFATRRGVNCVSVRAGSAITSVVPRCVNTALAPRRRLRLFRQTFACFAFQGVLQSLDFARLLTALPVQISGFCGRPLKTVIESNRASFKSHPRLFS